MTKRNKRTFKVECDGVMYESVAAAARYIKMPMQNLHAKFNKSNPVLIGDHILERLEVDQATKRGETITKTKSGKGSTVACPVICLNTSKEYKSFTELGREIGVSPWTLSLKTEKAGKFTDSQGNQYVRKHPMIQRTSRQYCVGSDSIVKARTVKAVRTNKAPVAPIAVPQVAVDKYRQLEDATKVLISKKDYAIASELCAILDKYK